MTPQEIETAARNKYNSVGASFWSSSEIFNLIYAACCELVRDCGIVIERVYTTTTVAGTQEYDFPTNAISIKRITYNGKKLMPYTMRDDDTITLSNQAAVDQSEPQYYFVWNQTISLRPLPDDAKTLKVYTINEPQTITSNSTLEVPTWTHFMLVDYVVSEMAAKDMNFQTAQWYRGMWDNHKAQISKKLRLLKTGDAFKTVQAEEAHPITTLGPQ